MWIPYLNRIEWREGLEQVVTRLLQCRVKRENTMQADGSYVSDCGLMEYIDDEKPPSGDC